MKKIKITKQVNSKKSPSTGSISVYDGPGSWGKKERTRFIEFADCHCKARLHKTDLDSRKDWLSKIDVLISVLKKYRKFSRKQK